jgi:hypothetical protein
MPDDFKGTIFRKTRMRDSTLQERTIYNFYFKVIFYKISSLHKWRIRQTARKVLKLEHTSVTN